MIGGESTTLVAIDEGLASFGVLPNRIEKNKEIIAKIKEIFIINKERDGYRELH